jgi:hypothetical protein
VIIEIIVLALPSIVLILYGFYLFVNSPAVRISDWLHFMICKFAVFIQNQTSVHYQ